VNEWKVGWLGTGACRDHGAVPLNAVLLENREGALEVNDKPSAEDSGPSKKPSRDTASLDAASGETQERTGTPYIEVSGSQATRELRDTSRRRREAEEKLQQHLMEAKEHAQEAEHAHDPKHSAHEKEESGKAKGRSGKVKEHPDKAETEEQQTKEH
jgi:hypothetical protein